MKNTQLNAWMWRWHTIAGLITLPVFALLALTGLLILLQSDYEALKHSDIRQVSPQNEQVSLQQQLVAATKQFGKIPGSYTIKSDPNLATEFVTGHHGEKSYVLVNQYTGEVTGTYERGDALFAIVRSLHGELMLGEFGSYMIELVNSWLFVLVVTGIFVWWPKKKFKRASFFTIRFNKGKRLLYRDLHSVLGAWTSLVLIVMLASGMFLTVVFGSLYKDIQKSADSGYPPIWRSGKSLSSTQIGDPLTLDTMVQVAKQLNLPGTITISLPKKSDSVFTVKNRTNFSDQQVVHIDQYSGEILRRVTWDEVGTMAAARSLFMRLHMGSFYGLPYWYLLVVSMVIFVLISVAGLVAYLMRKPQGSWGLTQVPDSFKANKLIVTAVVIFAVLLPLFGISLAIIIGASYLQKMLARKRHYKRTLGTPSDANPAA
ncbi:MAG: PepSY domain-containing protein [Gammaproteobacteria bacterium]|nr:PepSY domain-containing protein [Gammaproteobacteria bacterium]MCP4879112.1 PepSY domain-containing protein [Gammaproteobacteria bacterium]